MPELKDVTDPEEAIQISRRGLQRQREMDSWITTLVVQLETLRRENHISARMENLYGSRRWN